MTNTKVTPLLLIPVLALALNACAKRDSAFKKRAAQQAQQTKTTPPQDCPSKCTIETLPPGKGKIELQKPGRGHTGTEEQPDTKKPGTESPTEPVPEGADGALVHADNCVNPISMDPTGEEQALTLADLINPSNQGTYSLIRTHYFAEAEGKEGQKKEQIYALGSEFKTPAEFTSSLSDTQKVTVVCHTTQRTEGPDSSIRGSMDLANSFSAKDGKGTVIRQDNISAINGALFTSSTLYAGNTDLTQVVGDGKPQDLKVSLVKHDENQVTIKMKFTRQDPKTGKRMNVTMAATYSLSK